MQQTGDIYLDKYAGWYSVRDEAYYDEDETIVGEDSVRRGPAGLAGRMGRGGELLLPPVGLSGQAARRSMRVSPTSSARTRRNEVVELCQRRPEGSLGFAHHVRLGRQGAGRARACDVCLDRCADELHHRRRLSGRERRRTALLAGHLHIIGKDIVRFHAVYWPAFLMSAGIPGAEAGLCATASCSTGARRCRSRSATSSIPSTSPSSTASIRCAISSCAKCRSDRTATTTTKRSSRASMPISPTISATWRSARCR